MPGLDQRRGAVIGARAKDVPADKAIDHVRGYAVGIDFTLRDLQSEAKRSGSPWSVSKGFDGSAPGGLVIPKDDVGDPSGRPITLRVGDDVRQSSTTARMMHSVAELVAFASRWMTLEPGDLLFTGTPAGVGPVRPGDRVTGSIEGLPELTIEITE